MSRPHHCSPPPPLHHLEGTRWRCPHCHRWHQLQPAGLLNGNLSRRWRKLGPLRSALITHKTRRGAK